MQNICKIEQINLCDCPSTVTNPYEPMVNLQRLRCLELNSQSMQKTIEGATRIGAENAQWHVENSTLPNSMQFSIYRGGINCSEQLVSASLTLDGLLARETRR